VQYTSVYYSPLGDMVITADDTAVTGVQFAGQKHFDPAVCGACEETETPLIIRVKKWLDVYFSGKEPDFRLPLRFAGTDFQKEVWGILCTIPYGQTMTYGDIAGILSARRCTGKMSAQAVGGAVGRNPIAILVPCHRVIGKDGSMTGYAAGIHRKIALLQLENCP